MALLWIAAAYVLGSVPFGIVFAGLCGVDPRKDGSGNVGATNVARLCGTGWGVATLACDLLKGTVAVAAATRFSDSALLWTLTALAAVCGHLFSCFLRFKGGKAVAVSIGVLIPLAFPQLLAACLICILGIWRSGFVSLGSLTLVTVFPLLLLVTGVWNLLPLAVIIMIVVFWSHRANIRRLAEGEEKSWIRKTS